MNESQRSGQLILLVDDDASVFRPVTTALAMAGFRVIVAEDGVSGFEAFLQCRDEIDLVLADVIMPIMGGMEMAERIREIRADIPILLMSAYSDAVILARHPKYQLMRKPFETDDLVRIVRANFHRPGANA